jgi:glycosyltransferase involved in cell wall biosynthesis
MGQDRVSVIIPARNEAENIARAVRSVAAQPEVVEIIVVDDSSEDETPIILETLRAEVPRLRTLETSDPPPGWIGKTNAVATGARQASGNWLLFTDADTEHRPGSLAQVLDRAQCEGADLVSLSPGQQTPEWWEKAVIPFVFAELARRFRFEDVNDPRNKSAAANGQYILIRRAVYETVGGHEAVRGEILEDVALARLIKDAGRRILFLPGANWASTRMYSSFAALWDGWRKNLYLLWGCSVLATLMTFARVWFVDLAPPLAGLLGFSLALTGGGVDLAGIGVAGLVLTIVRRVLYSRELARLGFEPQAANYGIPGAALFLILLMESLAAHRWLGSVRWKGREYPTRGSGRRQASV